MSPAASLPATCAVQAGSSLDTASDSENNSSDSDDRSESGSGASSSDAASTLDYAVVNFYHLTDIANPAKVVAAHKAWTQGRDIKGRIYISTQGINAQYSGPQEDVVAYAQWVESQEPFQGLRWTGEAVGGHMFPKLRLKFRQNLVQLAGGTTSLPITVPEARAKPLAPAEWREMLRSAVPVASSSTAQSQQGAAGTASTNGASPADTKPVVVLDVRNGYEWDAGHFAGASRPMEDNFHETPTEQTGSMVPQYLHGVAPDTPVMMYCTGGIRCDIYSAYLKKQGFNNLYTLEGGIQNYLKAEGDEHWKGSLFVFDGRMAVAPGKEGSELMAAVACAACGSPAQLPHLNCANIDCNKLFVACADCKEQHQGCCCEACVDAPRLLRPLKEQGYYGAWGNYSSSADAARAIAQGRGSARRLERRRKHTERLRDKHAEQRAERMARRSLVKAALQAMEGEEQPAAAEVHTLEQPSFGGPRSATDDERAARLASLRERLARKKLAGVQLAA